MSRQWGCVLCDSVPSRKLCFHCFLNEMVKRSPAKAEDILGMLEARKSEIHDWPEWMDHLDELDSDELEHGNEFTIREMFLVDVGEKIYDERYMSAFCGRQDDDEEPYTAWELGINSKD